MVDAARQDRRVRRIALVGLTVVVVAAAAGAVLLQANRAQPASVDILPAAVLFAAPGQTRVLTARTLDGSGNVIEARVPAVTWSTSRSSTVSVSPDGTVTGVSEGSAQITAELAGMRSAPILVVVSAPAPGVTLVADEQVVSAPAMVDPAAPPSITNLYRVTLRGLTPAVGDRLLGTGGQPIAGAVTAVVAEGDAFVVTLRVVPLPELLPSLSIDETFDLTSAPIQIPADVARRYDITRTGNQFTFAPKEGFFELAATGRRSAAGGGAARLPVGLMAAAGGRLDPFGGRVQDGADFELPPQLPFEKCEGSLSTMPIQLSAPPAFSVEVVPSLVVLYTPDDRLQRWMLSATATAKVDVGLKATAAFEGKVACELTLYTFQIPVGGPLSIFLAGLVPVKAGMELSGKVTLASLEIGGEVSASTTGRLGIVCTGPAGCGVDRELGAIKADMKPRLDGPALEDLRLEPGLEASISFGGSVGSPILNALRLDLAEAKVGAKLAGDWAPRLLQIRDAAYAASYKLSVEAGVGLSSQLGEIATMLGLGTLTGAELKISTDLASSPTGTMTPDKTTYEAGDAGRVGVELTPAGVEFLGFYNVKELLLVRHSAGTITGLDAVDADAGDTRFELTFTAPARMPASELYVFLVTQLVPTDAFQLEVARAPSTPAILFSSSRGGRVDLYTVSPDGGEPIAVTSDVSQDSWPAWSPDRSRLAVVREGSQGRGIYVMNRDGTGERLLRLGGEVPAWSPDGTKIAFHLLSPQPVDGLAYPELWIMNADGSGARSLTPGKASTNTLPTWSPDSTRIAFVSDRDGSFQIYVMQADGSGGGRITTTAEGGYAPSWSPDGTTLAYTCARNGRGRICLDKLDGSGVVVIDTGSVAPADPTWSPDGKRLAFVGASAGNQDLYLINVDGSGLVRLTDDPAADQAPSW